MREGGGVPVVAVKVLGDDFKTVCAAHLPFPASSSQSHTLGSLRFFFWYESQYQSQQIKRGGGGGLRVTFWFNMYYEGTLRNMEAIHHHPQHISPTHVSPVGDSVFTLRYLRH